MTQRFTGPIGKSVQPWQAGAPLIARGRVLVQQCLDRMKWGGLKQFVTSERLPDGSTIRALVVNQGTGAPLIRVWVERPQPGVPLIPIPFKPYLEHGWVGPVEDGALWIALNTELATHYSSLKPIYGEYKWQAGEPVWCCVPDVDNRNMHLAQIPHPNDNSVIGVPTGLSMAYAQAKRGARRRLNEAFPDFFLPSWDVTGVQRDPEGDYWLLNVSQTNGLIAVRLVMRPEYRRLRDWMIETSLSELEHRLVEAYVLSALEIDFTLSEAEEEAGETPVPSVEERTYQLLDWEALRPAYYDGDNFYRTLAHGWQWFWQRGNDTAGAVRTGCFYDQGTDFWFSLTTELSLTWNPPEESGGQELPGYWSATITPQNSAGWGVNSTGLLRVPDTQAAGNYSVPLEPKGTPGAGNVPVYSFTSPQGVHHLRTVEQLTTPATDTPRPSDFELSIIGTGSIEATWGSTDAGTSGGWSCDLKSLQRNVVTGQNLWEFSGRIEPGETISGVVSNDGFDNYTPDWISSGTLFWIGTSFGNARMTTLPSIPCSGLELTEGDGSGYWNINTGVGYVDTTNTEVSAGFGGVAAVLSKEHTGVTLVSLQQSNSGRVRRYSGSTQTDGLDQPLYISHDDNRNGNVGPARHEPGLHANYWTVRDADGNTINMRADYGSTVLVGDEPLMGFNELEAYLISPTGEVFELDGWEQLVIAYEPDASVPGPTTYPTYGGDDIYMHKFGEWTLPGGVSEDSIPTGATLGGV